MCLLSQPLSLPFDAVTADCCYEAALVGANENNHAAALCGTCDRGWSSITEMAMTGEE